MDSLYPEAENIEPLLFIAPVHFYFDAVIRIFIKIYAKNGRIVPAAYAVPVKRAAQLSVHKYIGTTKRAVGGASEYYI